MAFNFLLCLAIWLKKFNLVFSNTIYMFALHVRDNMLEQKMVQLVVNWINDEDNPYGESKIWCYFSR